MINEELAQIPCVTWLRLSPRVLKLLRRSGSVGGGVWREEVCLCHSGVNSHLADGVFWRVWLSRGGITPGRCWLAELFRK